MCLTLAGAPRRSCCPAGQTVFAIASATSARPTDQAGVSVAADALRTSAQRVRNVLQEEVLDTCALDEIPAATAALDQMLAGALADSGASAATFALPLITFVRQVEARSGAHRGCLVLLPPAIDAVYADACEALRLLGQYPLRWSEHWDAYRPQYLRLQERRAAARREADRRADSYCDQTEEAFYAAQ